MAELAAVEQLLRQLMSADNAIRGQAEQAYGVLKKDPAQHCNVLMGVLANSQDSGIKTLAAVLLRRWFNYSDEFDPEKMTASGLLGNLKQGLLQVLTTEPDENTRFKIGDTVGSFSSFVLEDGNFNLWPELIPFLLQLSSSNDVPQRLLGLSIFLRLSQNIGDHLRQFIQQLFEVFKNSLEFPDLRVAAAACESMSAFLGNVEEKREISVFQRLIPASLQALGNALQQNKEQEAEKIVESFETIIEEEPLFFKPYIRDFVFAMLSVIENQDVLPDLRHVAVEALVSMSELASPMMRKVAQDRQLNFLPRILVVLMTFLGNIDHEEAWANGKPDDDDFDDDVDVAERSVDRLALAMGGRIFRPAAEQLVTEAAGSAQWNARYAAIMTLSLMAEGCASSVDAARMAEYAKAVAGAVEDTHPRVRWAACNALGQMSTDFAPRLEENCHEIVLRALIRAMQPDNVARVRGHASTALINFSEEAERDIMAPYLRDILAGLLSVLQCGNRFAQEQAVSGLAGVANAAEDLFGEFYQHFVQVLLQVLQSQEKSFRLLRAKAIEAISLIAIAVGKERSQADVLQVIAYMQHVQNAGIEEDDPQLEYFLQAYSNFCQVLKEDFVPYIGMVVPKLLHMAQAKPEMKYTDVDDDDADEEEDDGFDTVVIGGVRIGIRTSIIEEKANAVQMLVSYMTVLKQHFAPFIKETAEVVVPLLKFHLAEDVRIAAALCCTQIFQVYYLANAPEKTQILQQILASLISALERETEVDVRHTLMIVIKDVLDKSGPGTLPLQHAELVSVEQITQLVLNLVKTIRERIEEERKRKNHIDDFDEEEEEDVQKMVEQEEQGLVLLSDLVGPLFRHYPEFSIMFKNVISQGLEQFLRSSNSTERQFSVLMLDEAIESCPESALPEMIKYAAALVAAMVDPAAEVRQAACFGVGVAAMRTQTVCADEFVANYVPQALQNASNILKDKNRRRGENNDATDNAVAAVCKILQFHGARLQAGSGEQMLRLVMTSLPLRSDKTEGHHVYGFFVSLLEQNNPVLLQDLGRVSALMVEVMNTDFVNRAISERMRAFLVQMAANPEAARMIPETVRTQMQAMGL